jgi:L-ribulose-5-phosphate 3-epimerase UlaE
VAEQAAALADEGNTPFDVAPRLAREQHVQPHAVDVVGHAEAIGSHDRKPGIPRGLGDGVLGRVIADLGNCWMERDYEATLRGAGDRVAAVQFADAVFGTPEQPSPGGRAVPGDGDLDVVAFLRAAVDAGYAGAFELEMVGPLIESEGHEPALRRAVTRWSGAGNARRTCSGKNAESSSMSSMRAMR